MLGRASMYSPRQFSLFEIPPPFSWRDWLSATLLLSTFTGPKALQMPPPSSYAKLRSTGPFVIVTHSPLFQIPPPASLCAVLLLKLVPSAVRNPAPSSLSTPPPLEFAKLLSTWLSVRLSSPGLPLQSQPV